MTRDETVVLMDAIKTMYPRFYEMSDDMDSVVDLWHDMLQDYPLNLALQAFRAFTSTDTKGFPPVIGQIIHEINEITQPAADIPSESEAWEQVKRAISNGLYHSRTEYDKLHPILRRVVGSPDAIWRWANMEEEFVDMNIRPMICRSYNQYAEKERADRLLPPSMQENVYALRDAAKPALSAPEPEPERQAIPEPQEPKKDGFSGPGFERFMEGMKELAEKMSMDKADREHIEIIDPDAERRSWTEERAREMGASI